MTKYEKIDSILKNNNGYIKTSEVTNHNISKQYFYDYARNNKLKKVAQGLYMSNDAWPDVMYVLQVRYPSLIFSHESASYMLGIAEREPIQNTITLKRTTNSSALNKEGLKVYKVKEELFEIGLTYVHSPSRHILRCYNLERTICDFIRSKKNIEIQDFQSAMKGYVQQKEKNIPQLLRYAKLFSVESRLRQYLEVLL